METPEEKQARFESEGSQRQRWSHDPYSMAMRRIVPSLRFALRWNEKMSEDEYTILIQLSKIIEVNDPASFKDFKDVRVVNVIK